jgi:hypothetical protein
MWVYSTSPNIYRSAYLSSETSGLQVPHHEVVITLVLTTADWLGVKDI